MREIKFRTWDKNENVMRSWNEVILEKEAGDNFYTLGYKENRAITSFNHEQLLMQNTELKDKNGIEIYEGDVIRDIDNRVHTVIYERGMFGCYKSWLVSYETGERRKSIESLSNFLVDESVVVGNIYENPELKEVNQ